jgi:outer membrane protein TolC
MHPFIRLGCLICLLVLAAPQGVAAQDSVQGRLTTLLSRGMTDNPVVGLQEEALRRAQGEILQEEGVFDWRTTMEGGLVRRRVVKVSPSGDLTDDTEWQIFKEVAGGVGKRFRNGIEVSPGVRAYFGEQNASHASRVVSQTDIQPSFHIKIPLLARSGVDEVTAPLRAAKRRLTATQYRKLREEAKLARDMTVAYWQCVGSGERVAAEVELTSTMKANASRQQRLMRAGEVPPAAYLSPAAELATQQIALNEARRTQSQVCRQLAALIGTADLSSLLLPRLPSPEQIYAPDASVEDLYVETALMQRHDLMALGAELMASEIGQFAAKDNKKPDLDLILDLDRVLLRLAASPQNRYDRGYYDVARARYGEARLTLALAQRDARNEVLDAILRLRDAISAYTEAARLETDMRKMREEAASSVARGLSEPEVELDATRRLVSIRRSLIDAGVSAWVALADLQLGLGAIPSAEGGDYTSVARIFLTDPKLVDTP